MDKPQNPTDIAREALKRLASQRVAPTPENFSRFYKQIAGLPETPAGEGWGDLVRELLRQWERKQGGLTVARKREALERVLINFGRDATQLREKLDALVRSWAGYGGDAGGELVDEPAPAEPAAQPVESAPQGGVPLAMPGGADEARREALELLAQTITYGVVPRLQQTPELADEAARLADAARAVADAAALTKLEKALKQLWIKLELRGEGDQELMAALYQLLNILIENISELVLDDQWLHGQIAVVRDILAKPLSSRVIFEAEQSFKNVVFKQGTLKRNLNEAKQALKQMLTTFIDRLGEMSASTGDFHDKIGGYAERLSGTEDIYQINEILAELMRDTRGMQLDVQRTSDELLAARSHVEEQERKIRELETELDQVSEMVHQDHLTGTLNRRGMEEAFAREFARAERLGTPLCVAILDVDHFKRFNDTYGHDAGDQALIHLVRVVRELMRPTDEIARFGGEEFVIILPDTEAAEASNVMLRVQRELTRKFFLHKNQRLLITFSAGVARRRDAEPAESLLGRADAALYQAKEAGRNRVITAGA